jgi:predicted protein tyrosine phosphatase
MKPFNEIKILSQEDALKEAMENPGKWNIISLWSGGGGKHGSEQPKFNNKEKSLCQQRFHDITLEPWQAEAEGKITPNDEHIKTILKFARTKYNEPLVVHCFAGISRSSAITFCILLDYFKDTEDPINNTLSELIQIKSPNLILPNKRIVGLGIYNIAKDGGQVMEWFRKLYNHRIFEMFFNTNKFLL